MADIIEGSFSGNGLKLGVVAARFNEFVTKSLVDGALNELRRLGVQDSDIYLAWVPGAYEIPAACQTMIDTRQPDALVTIGCVIRGETSHYEHIAQSVSDALQKIALERRMPIGFSVLTVENLEQAIDRAGGKQGNKGREAARTAVEMANLFHALKNDETEKEKAVERLLNEEFKKLIESMELR